MVPSADLRSGHGGPWAAGAEAKWPHTCCGRLAAAS
jgi:hypothetical protein